MARSLVRHVAWLAILGSPASARAQATPLPESIAVGGFVFRPSLEVRVRGEYRNRPVDTGGHFYDSTAVLDDAAGTRLPTVSDVARPLDHQWLVAERSRVGLAADRGPVTAAFVLQDARVFGSSENVLVGPGQPVLPSLSPFEAYVDVHTTTGRKVFFRIGRQKVVWGDGRLVGESDWSETGRSLDAARFGASLGDFDLELLAAILSAPGGLPPTVSGQRRPADEGPGSQIYGLDVRWHPLPLLGLEATGLVRVVREPRPFAFTPGDTYVIDGRIFGDKRGFTYSAEGAYELGRVAAPPLLASTQNERPLRAWAVAARSALETSLPWHLTFGAEGAIASGGTEGDDDPNAVQTRFDPILPDDRTSLGKMRLYGWTNLIEVGGDVAVRPTETLRLELDYRAVGLAQPDDRWSTADLIPVGATPGNGDRFLGHELHAGLRATPYGFLEIEAGYGLFVFGEAAKAVIREARRLADEPIAQHWGYLQTRIRAP